MRALHFLLVPAKAGNHTPRMRSIRCHCEPTGRANAPDDRLREAIHLAAQRKSGIFVASAPRNDVAIVSHTTSFSRRGAPEVLLLPSAQSASGMPDARSTRRLVCTWVLVESTRATTSTPDST